MRRSPLAVCLVVVALFALAAAHDHHVAKNTKDSKVSSSASEQSAVPWTAPDACRRMPHFLLETLTRNRTLAAFARSRHLSAERASWAIEATADAADASFEHMSAEALAVSVTAPQQLHIALAGAASAMSVAWATTVPVPDSIVWWWPYGARDPSSPTAPAALSTYTAGITGWNGTLYEALMTGLVPGAQYQYMVGSPSLQVWSQVRSFRAAVTPSKEAVARIAVTADQGTIVPLGWAVADALTQAHVAKPYDAVILSGDISYATLSPPKNEMEWVWDSFMVQVEPYASTTPFMTTVGNHDAVPGNITNSSGTFTDVWGAAFEARLRMPAASSGGHGNLWFSFNVGPIHFASVSSEHNYSAGSPQALWLDADLAAVDRSVTPWIILSLHRPVYSADASEYDSHSPGGALARWLEPVGRAHKVDLVLQGHVHCAERVHPQYNGTVVALPTNEGAGPASQTYRDPGAPMYIVQGTAGAFQRETFVDPAPAWSAFRLSGAYGYGIMEVTGAGLLEYTFVDTVGAVHDTWRIVKTGL